MKYILSLVIILSSAVCSAKELTGWPIGSWDCRHWGGLGIHKHGITTNIGAEGDLLDLGYWQWFDDHTIIIMWEDSQLLEGIYKDPKTGKFYHQEFYGYSNPLPIKECKKTFIAEEDK